MKPIPLFQDFLSRGVTLCKRLVFYSRLIEINTHLEELVKARTAELEEANRQLTEKEETLIFQNEALKIKEELLTAHNEELAAQEEELTDYISRLSEQQERERVVRWIVMSIRESLELDQVISRTTQEIGYLLKVDRCFVTAYQPSQQCFQVLQTIYRSSEAITPISDAEILVNLCPQIQQQIIHNLEPVIIHHTRQYEPLAPLQAHCDSLGIQSTVMIPLVNQNELLGALVVHQVLYPREWSDKEVETLKDIAQQVSIAIYQANLYREVQEATRLKSEFLANMSHEFRTPLNAIIGFSEMILSEHYGPLTQKQRDYTQNVIKSGQHLLTLVNDILDLSKVESGNMELHYELFNIPKTILEITNIIKGMAYKKKIEVLLQMDIEVHCAYADPARFKQILYNLLSNAIKFTPENGQIELRVSLLAEHQKTLVIAVKDTGIGISPCDGEKVFHEFQQIDASYARKQEGSGLGLALTRKLVELHGGSISFTSQLGLGTTFTVQLPCHIGGELPKGRREPSNKGLLPTIEQVSQQLASRQIKIRSDDPTLVTPLPVATSMANSSLLLITPVQDPLFRFHETVTKLPHSFKSASSHEALLEVFHSSASHPDLILLDTHFLEKEDASIVKTLFNTLKIHPSWAKLPVVLVTTDPQNSKLGSIGIIDYWTAPFTDSLWIKQIDKIRQNLLKETSIHLLGLGEHYIPSLLQHPDILQKKSQFKLSQLDTTSFDLLSQICQDIPDLILLEIPYPLETEKLAILEMLKSRTETKYIPIVLIGSFPPPSFCQEGQGHTPVKQSSLLTQQKPVFTRLRTYANLAKDIDYALRINKETV